MHVPDWLDQSRQRDLVEACRDWSRGPVPMASPTLPSGATMSLQMVCLGWHWIPYRYVKVNEAGQEAAAFPDWMRTLARDAVKEALGDTPEYSSYEPDAALINFYGPNAKLGQHQDKDESSGAPVVSLSLGDSCIFRFGNTENRNRPYTDLELRSGDLFVFGGPARLAYHGVTKVMPGSGPPGIGLDTGRLNITIRQTGLQPD
ncbi:MAG: alpha-ketoglutarate-dependent dioxygenase AlkB [Solirubrobacterales bacterium]